MKFSLKIQPKRFVHEFPNFKCHGSFVQEKENEKRSWIYLLPCVPSITITLILRLTSLVPTSSHPPDSPRPALQRHARPSLPSPPGVHHRSRHRRPSSQRQPRAPPASPRRSSQRHRFHESHCWFPHSSQHHQAKCRPFRLLLLLLLPPTMKPSGVVGVASRRPAPAVRRPQRRR